MDSFRKRSLSDMMTDHMQTLHVYWENHHSHSRNYRHKTLIQFFSGEACLLQKKDLGVNLEDLPCKGNSCKNECFHTPLPVWSRKGEKGRGSRAILPTSSPEWGLLAGQQLAGLELGSGWFSSKQFPTPPAFPCLLCHPSRARWHDGDLKTSRGGKQAQGGFTCPGSWPCMLKCHMCHPAGWQGGCVKDGGTGNWGYKSSPHHSGAMLPLLLQTRDLGLCFSQTTGALLYCPLSSSPSLLDWSMGREKSSKGRLPDQFSDWVFLFWGSAGGLSPYSTP